MLDKTPDTGYNIHTGYSEVNYLDISKGKESSRETEKDLLELCTVINKLTAIHNNYPLIAGGAIRDFLLGHSTPKDFDIFIDVSSIEDEDEQQDFIDTFLYDFCVAIRDKDFGPTVGWPYSMEPMEGEHVQEQYKDMDGTFKVYEWHSDANNTSAPYQFIFMKNPMIQTDPAQWVLDKFDYSLVKCFMDPATTKVYASDEFMNDKDESRITVHEERTRKRLLNWVARTGAPYTPVLYTPTKPKDKNETRKTKPPAVPKMFLDGRLQHPKKWVG